MKVSDYLTREEVAHFTAKSDWHAWRLLIGNWAFIAAIFATAAAFPNPLVLLLAIILLAGRQLGLSVLMHDAGHRTLFKTQWLNEVMGQWFCALPVMNDQPSYAKGHLEHHDRRGLEAYVAKHNRYSTLEAAEIVRQMGNDTEGTIDARLRGDPLQRRRWIKRHLYPKLPAKWLFRFLFMYVLRLGFLDGLTGLRFCLFIASYELQISLKIVELLRQREAEEGS